MIGARIWIFFLALLAVAGGGTALLTKGVIQRRFDEDVTASLRRDRFEMELVLKLDARTRIDDIAPLAANEDVRAVLRGLRENHDEAAMRDANMRMKNKLQELNRQLAGAAGDIVFALNDNGTIIAQLGPNEAAFGGSLSGFPLVERALEGFIRDDVWVYDNQVYRMAARPIIDGGQFVGALVLGKRMDEKFAEIVSGRLSGATVAFFRGTTLLASHAGEGAPAGEELSTELSSVVRDDVFKEGEPVGPKNLRDHAMAIYAQSVGDAASAKVGYGIARTRPVIHTTSELLALITKDDLAHAPIPLIAGAGFLLFLIGMLLTWFEHDAPLRKLAAGAAKLAVGNLERYDLSTLKRAHRRIANDINQALDRVASTASPAKANIDELLGAPPENATPAFFAFGDMPSASVPPATTSKPPVVNSKPPTLVMSKPPTNLVPSTSVPPTTPMHSLPAPAGPQTPTASVPPPPPPPRSPASVPPPPKTPTIPPTADSDATQPTAPLNTDLAPASTPPPLPRSMPVSPGMDTLVSEPPAAMSIHQAPMIAVQSATPPSNQFTRADYTGEDRVAPPPPRMPNTSNTRPAPAPPLLTTPPHMKDFTYVAGNGEESATFGTTPGAVDAPTSAEQSKEAHFREVFQEYITSKQNNGESTSGVSFEKFEVTLRDQHDKIIAEHGASDVRFSVYIKDGKTKLRATPIK